MSWLLFLLRNLFSPKERQLPPQGNSETLPSGRAAKQLVLSELQDILTRQFEAADALDDKLKSLLEAATLILTIATTLQIATGASQAGWIYWIILIITLGVYVALILTALRGLRPMDYHSPIPSTWEEIAERFFDLDEDAGLELMISNYLEYSRENNAPLSRKVRQVRLASGLLVAIVVLLMAMGLFGLGSSSGSPWQSTSATPVVTSTIQLSSPTITSTVVNPTPQKPVSTIIPTADQRTPTATPTPTVAIQSPIVTPIP